jgi:O-antigen/teichoic acid export membrane protein
VTAAVDAPTLAAAGEPLGALERPKRRNVLALGAAQAITWSVTLLWTFVVPRRLGASGWGMLVTGSSIASIFGVLAGLGTTNYLVREFVRRPGDAGATLGTSLTLRTALVVPSMTLLTVYVYLVDYSATQRLIIFIAAAGVCFLLLSEPFDSVFQAVERFEFFAIGDVVNTAGQSLLAVGLVLLGFGVVPVAASALAVVGVVFNLKWLWARRFFRPQFGPTVAQARAMARESTPYWMMSAFVMFYVWVDTAMLSLMAPAHVVGWYGMPIRLFGTLQFAANMLSRLWLPRLIASFESSDSDFNRVARIPVEQALVIGMPVSLGAFAVAQPLIALLFGSDFGGAAPPMAILSLCLLPLYLNIIAYAILVASGKQMVWTKIIIGASIVNPLINVGAIRFFQARNGNGAIGAATSLLVTETLIATLALVFVTRGIVTLRSLSRPLRSMGAALVMAGAVHTIQPWGLFLQVVVGVLVYVGLALLLKVPREQDLETLRELISRVRRRGRPESEGLSARKAPEGRRR